MKFEVMECHQWWWFKVRMVGVGQGVFAPPDNFGCINSLVRFSPYSNSRRCWRSSGKKMGMEKS
jgi:hypothetical protein